ncbi:BrnT family toxin [Variovorax sp. LG9.2]|nr:BrnT family toxin [Variovorax sp. LG9.2]
MVTLRDFTASHTPFNRNVHDGNIQIMVDLSRVTGFDWDKGNARKNEKHGVSMAESEQVFFNAPLLLLEDGAHSRQELRLRALGRTDEGRTLHITFTLRQANLLIRVISVRDMHRKERAIYDQAD